jgi:hypothetical protein
MAIMQNENAVLARVEQAIMAKVDPKAKSAVMRIVAAGMKVMFSQQTHELMLQTINKPGDMIENVADGVAELMILMYKQSRGTMPVDAAIPASVILLCHALDYMAKAGKIQISNDVVAQATKAMMAYLMQRMGITPDKMQAVGAKAQQMAGKGA